MATYLPDGAGMFPQEQGFTPNYNFIMRTLEMRQNQYDQGFAQVKSVYNSVLSSELLREDNQERRDLILANAQKALKDLPMVDLSVAKNVSAAKGVFQPFYEDNYILNDMVFTKGIKSEISRGMSLRDAADEKERKRYWTHGVQDLYDQIDEFKSVSADAALNMRNRRYVGKPQVADEIFELFKDGKLKVSIDEQSGMEMITYENGQQSVTPIANLYISKVMNDPEAFEGFNVYGRVERNRFIKDNVANGKYATQEEAANAHTQSLINDYTALQDKGIAKSTETLNLVNTYIKNLQEMLDRGEILQGSKEEQQLAFYEITASELTEKIKEYTTNKQNASSIVERNPAGYLGQVFLHKSANDLAVALSSVNMSKKITSNTIYKDFIFPKEFEVFKTNESIRLEQEKSRLNILEQKYKNGEDTEEDDGSSSGATGTKGKTKGPSVSELNSPQVKESPAASGIQFENKDGSPSAYKQTISEKTKLLENVTQLKAGFVMDVLSPEELVDENNQPLDQNQIRALVTKNGGVLLDKLYTKAMNKAKTYKDTDAQKFNSFNQIITKVNNGYAAITALDKWKSSKLTEIIGNISATKTIPEKVETGTVTRRTESGLSYNSNYTKVIPGKNEGWMYQYLIKSNGLLAEENQPDEFIAGVTKDKNFEDVVNKRYEENLKAYRTPNATELINPLYGSYKNAKRIVFGEPTKEQARTQVINEFKEKFSTYRDEVLKEWDKRGLNFSSQYAAMPGGGGITARTLTFKSSSLVQGEIGDQIVADLLTKLPGIGGGATDVFVLEGRDKAKNAKKEGDEELKNLLLNGILGTELMNSIKLGKSAMLQNFDVETSMVGGGDANYNAYTITFDPKFISEMKGTETKEGPLGTTASKLTNGITIYVKKDKDNTLAATKSSVGEIDILVNTNPQGVHEHVVIPGDSVNPKYSVTAYKNSITGTYKLITSFPEITAANLNGTVRTEEVNLPANTDLTSAFYDHVNKLNNMYLFNEGRKKEFVKSQPNKATRESVNFLKQKGVQ